MIVLISGKQGSGKTTTADKLSALLKAQGFEILRTRFAEPLYKMHDKVREVLKSYGYDNGYEYDVKDGPLLQLLGTEWGRALDENIWVKLCKLGAESFVESAKSAEYYPVVIIDDCRFKNEFDAFPEALRVRLECSEDTRKGRAEMWRDRTTHPSEVDLDDWVIKFDMVFNTGVQSQDSVVEMICERVKQICKDPGTGHDKEVHAQRTEGSVEKAL